MTDAPNRQLDDTVQRLAELHDEHDRAAGPVQRMVDRATRQIGRPGVPILAIALVIGWLAANLLAPLIGIVPIETTPFSGLALFATASALLISLLILTTQRHENDLADKRARLTLHIAVMSEEKVAKIIGLLEEQRRDNPLLVSRHDAQAEEMAQPSDPVESLQRMEEALGRT